MATIQLSGKLKELRKVNGYTQDYIADYLDVSRQTYSHYETGRRTPDFNTLSKLATFYSISIETLITLATTNEPVSYTNEKNPVVDELAEFLTFYSEPGNIKKYQYNTRMEKELLFLFSKLSDKDRKELIEIAKIKVRNK